MDKPRGHFISIQTKFSVLILACTLFTALVIGGVGIRTSISIIDTNSLKIMDLTVSDSANFLNNKMRTMAQLVSENANYAQIKLRTYEDLKNPIYRHSYLQDLQNVLKLSASSDEFVYAYFLQLAPELSSGDAGIYCDRYTDTGDFSDAETINFENYESEDSMVNWYYEAREAGSAIWIKPHYDEKYDSNVISYVMPMYKNGVFIGALGMHIDFSSITDYMSSIEPYDGSNAFLMDNKGHIVYHKTLPVGTNLGSIDSQIRRISQRIRTERQSNGLISYMVSNKEYKINWRTLENNMKLVLTAPSSSIDADRNGLIQRIIVAAISISFVFYIFTMALVRHIINPIKKLRQAASKLSEGDLDVSLKPEFNDEVGDLTVSFSKNATALKKYVEQVKVLAYRDSLTGVKSKTAYQDYVIQFTETIIERSKPFSIVVFDINNLKKINDWYGHNLGDKYITNCCACVTKNFKYSPIFRIGGDEFVVLIEDNSDYIDRYQILESIEREMKASCTKDNPVEYNLSIAYGIADFDPDTSPLDITFTKLFDIADAKMYEKKKEMKQN